MKKFIILAAVLALFTGSASATEYGHEYKKAVTYKTVTVYVEKQVPYTVNVVKYDSYGHPYTVTVTKHKIIQVPVQKQVPVYSHGRSYE
ncbi:hypothetical protein [Zavarzinella formosa]|uniref:hypothetical protein n=1 Tax=Zavarzinella formosa TaxID=360055 RepID=UPI0012FAC2E3|nr:hypothetical protein [Zavarzinella formosa]